MEADRPVFAKSRERRDHVKPYTRHVFLCYSGKTCPTKGSQELVGRLRAMLESRRLKDAVKVTKSGCLSLCDIGPNMVIYPDGVWYSGVTPADLEEILERHLIKGKPVRRLMRYALPK